MNLEERYSSSTKNVRGTSYNLQGTLGRVRDTSGFNIDRIPGRYNTRGVLGQVKDTSDLNIDVIPTKYFG